VPPAGRVICGPVCYLVDEMLLLRIDSDHLPPGPRLPSWGFCVAPGPGSLDGVARWVKALASVICQGKRRRMQFQRGQSGNPAGGPKGPKKRPERIRKLIAENSYEIIEAILRDAKAGDVAARQMFMKYMWARQRFISTPITLPLIDSLEVARAHIAILASMAMRGEIDLDSTTAISRTIALAAGLRLEELEELLADREADRRSSNDLHWSGGPFPALARGQERDN